MNILFKGEEHYISALNNGHNLYGTPIAVIVSGIPICANDKLCEGAKDITEYCIEVIDGVEINVEVMPKPALVSDGLLTTSP